ncbi:MAG: TolC family protein [Aquirufa sp.]
MKQVFLIIIISGFFVACQQNVIRRTTKINQELHQMGSKEVKAGISKVTTFWKADSSLSHLIEKVLSNNLDVKMNQLSISLNRQQYIQDRGLLSPNASLILQPGLRKFGKYTMDGIGNYDTQFSPNITKDQIIPEILPDVFLGFQSTWELDIWGKLAKKKKASAYRFLASEVGQKWYETNIISEVASLYGQLIALDKELEILKFNTEIQKNALDLVKIQKQAGIVNESVVQQFEAQWLNTQAQEGEIFQKIIFLENSLKQWLNDPGAIISRSAFSQFEKMNQTDFQTIEIDELENRLDIQQAKLELLAQISDKESAEKSLKPSLVLTGMIGFQGFRPEYLFQLPSSIAFSFLSGLSKPILNRTMVLSEIGKANTKVQALEMNYQKKLLTGFLEWDAQFKSLSYLKNMSILKDREVHLTKESISTVRTLFTSAQANYLEVLTTQQNALKSELELLEINRKRWINSVNLYRILGGGK